ncbi:cytochrome P450 81E8 [Arachis ipaensis]|uniref:cytochrome P450 81E8 n=1 Tax=Arachis ipaensis TaxID=130454 RepID=UPI0007AFB3CB|nr:cytochrome P450 81E8 [Arachis ipaensis]XP_025642766.1 cytochrome P450 81E8 [Arachis hypogaea]QHN99603.1 Cytochrome P450 [Arachis hypogaea]
MEEASNWLIPTSIFLLFFFLVSKYILQIHGKHKNLPPSPPSLPMIGHLHLIKQPLHQSFHNLTQKYGHMLFLKLGTRKVLVVSSPSAIEECFTKNDITFANRPTTLAAKLLNYGSRTIGFASYGDHWRSLRRLTTLELFSTNRLAMFESIREEEIRLLVKELFQECSKGGQTQKLKVELRPKFVEVSFNMLLRMISGKRYYGKDIDEEGKEFQILMKEFTALQASCLNDFIPIPEWIDFQGMKKKMVNLMKRVDSFLQKLLDEIQRNRSIRSDNNNGKLNLIEVMLDLQDKEPELYTYETMKGVILAMLIAGSETSAITMEWAVSLLLNNPQTMKKLQHEIETHAGHDQLLNESNASKMKYLQNIITETLRIYPVAPLLLPHESSSDCNVCGYDIPKGTMLLVNLWTLQRDPNLWADPTKFVPERFDDNGDGSKVCYNVIPFGVGRRACPGAVLAKHVMGHALGALFQCFEWEKIEDQVDMAEGIGLTLPKAKPLVAFCKPRQEMVKVLSNI